MTKLLLLCHLASACFLLLSARAGHASGHEVALKPIYWAAEEDSLEHHHGLSHRISENTQLELGGSFYHLTNGFNPWTSAYLEGSYNYGVHKTLYGKIEYLNEYNFGDGYAFLGTYYPIIDPLTIIVEGEVGFAHRITPLWSLFGQLNYRIIPGLIVDAGYRNSEYRDAAGVNNEVQLYNIGAEYWFSSFRAAYTFYESRGNGGLWNPPSHLLELGYYYTDESSITLGIGKGHEVERIYLPPVTDNPTLDVFDTRTLFLLGRHWFTHDWAVSYELGWHQIDRAFTTTPLYDRYGIRLGIRHRF
jgi:YaiO family outer membrane protein